MLTAADRTALAGWTNLVPGGPPRFGTALPNGRTAMVARVGEGREWRIVGVDGEVRSVGEAATAERAVVAVMRTVGRP